MPYIFYNKKPKRAYKPRYVAYKPGYRNQYRKAAQQRDTATVVLKYSTTNIFVKTEGVSSGVLAYNIWKALTDSPFYDKYATIFDQVKINSIRVQINPYTKPTGNSYVLTAAFDRNGISDPTSGITETKISSYSSAKSIMVNFGSKNTLYINNFPVTRTEKEQYVPTSIVPNIAASLTDDAGNETSMVGS